MGGFVQRIEGFLSLPWLHSPPPDLSRAQEGCQTRQVTLVSLLTSLGPQFTLLKNGYVGDNYCLEFLRGTNGPDRWLSS